MKWNIGLKLSWLIIKSMETKRNIGTKWENSLSHTKQINIEGRRGGYDFSKIRKMGGLQNFDFKGVGGGG